jgi:alpha-L-arabinofuranosidase
VKAQRQLSYYKTNKKNETMKLVISISATLLALAGLNAQNTIHIDASKPGATINPNFYGIFFEEINHAVEGGLYGEMVRNRDFEGNRMPEDMTRSGNLLHTKKGWLHFYPQPDSLAGWNLNIKGDAVARASQTNEKPLNNKNPMAMKVDIAKLGKGNVDIINQGFWGIAVEKGKKYNFSAYIQADPKFKKGVEVKLENSTGKVLASQVIANLDNSWKKFTCTLVATETEANARLVISPLSAGQLYLDMVSLFPEETYKNRNNGMRKDIADLIEGVRPGFLRFPGGCIVEGATLENRVKWENTIGDVAKRPGHWVLWDYHSTDGVGFHEYLQFCEDLGCPPMYVIPVGMSCQFRKCEHKDTSELKPYIDEVMNALEYAMGSVSSKWGAVRAQNGHPQPFKIKYLEIGNENYGPIYQEHYNIFYKAIKAKYPELQTIACTDPGMRSAFKRSDLPGITEPIEMIDEHFYESPDFFYKNATRYDSYDRKGPKVYVGEYAVKKWDNSLKGSLEASIAEAAFMTGMERNADIVQLSSMAPTFVNLNDQTWNPDLIAYNNAKSYGNPSYHVQKLFAINLADRVLPVTTDFDHSQMESNNKGWGMLGFNHIGVEAEYKDISVTINGKTYEGASLFTDNVMKMQKDGIFYGNRKFLPMEFRKEVYDQAATDKWNNYTLNLKAKANAIDDLEALCVLFYTYGPDKHLKWNLSRHRRWSWLEWYDHGYESYFGQQPGEVELNRWYDIEIQVKNDSVFCSLDHKLVHAVPLPVKVIPTVYSSAGVKNNGDIIVKVVNATDQPQKTKILVDGASDLNGKGAASVITHSDKFAGNTLETPENVSAKTSPFDGVSNNFEYEFLPHSITVLTLTKNNK